MISRPISVSINYAMSTDTPKPSLEDHIHREKLAYNIYVNKMKEALSEAYLTGDKQFLQNFADDELVELKKKSEAKYPDIVYKVDRRAWESIYKVMKAYVSDALKSFDEYVEHLKSQPTKPPTQDPTAEVEDAPFRDEEDAKDAPADALEEAKKQASYAWAHTTAKRIKEALEEPKPTEEDRI